MILLEKNQRVPADMVLLSTSEEEGSCFVRTDQLDGETDWKLKIAVRETQKLGEGGVSAIEGSLYGKSPLRQLESTLTIQPIHPSRIYIPSTEF